VDDHHDPRSSHRRLTTVTDPRFPDQRRDVDHGTRLGLGTRALTAIMRWTVRTGRSLARVGRGTAAWLSSLWPPLERVGRATAAWLSSLWPPLERVGRATAAWLSSVWQPLERVARRIGRWLAVLLARSGRILRWILIGTAVVLLGPTLVLVGIGAGVALQAELLALSALAVVSAIPMAIVLSLVVGGRALRPRLTPIVRALARALRRALDPIGSFMRRVGRTLDAARQPVGRTLGRAGRALSGFVTAAASAIDALLATLGRAIARATRAGSRPVHRVAAIAGGAIAAAATAVGRALATMGAVAFRPLRALAGSLGRALGTFGRAVASLSERAASALGSWYATATQRVVHSVGVAAGRAREPLDSGSPAWDVPASAAPGTTPAPPFTVEVFHNEYLPDGGTRIDAIITVTAQAMTTGGGPAHRERSEVILVDCSGSMGHPWRKIRNARAATAAAIDALPDGTWFAVVRANHDAEPVYPLQGGLAPKTPETQAAAERALRRLLPEGGTAMGRWLLLARDLLATRPGAIPHAILLTDGRNESESPDALAAALRSCAGRFQCDCRGVGTDWEVTELRTIADDLFGTVDLVAHPDDLMDDFRAMAEAAAAKQVDRVALRVWTPAGATLRFIRQVAPHIVDLGSRPVRVDERTVDLPTGAWSAESRDYHLCVDLPPRPVGAEMLAARVRLAVGHQVTAQALVTAVWTQDLEHSSRIVPEVVHYTGQAELLRAVQEGMEAHARGDDETATSRLGVATRLAFESGNDATLRLLANVVEIEDAATGRVHPRASVDDVDRMALETRSTRTARVASPVA
jgi:hypothetical protein